MRIYRISVLYRTEKFINFRFLPVKMSHYLFFSYIDFFVKDSRFELLAPVSATHERDRRFDNFKFALQLFQRIFDTFCTKLQSELKFFKLKFFCDLF